MMKLLTVLFFLQVSCLIASSYVHEGERTKEGGSNAPSRAILKPTTAEDDSDESALVSASDSLHVTEQPSLFAGQELDSKSPTTFAIEPNWLSSYEDAEKYLNNWDPEKEGNGAITDPMDEEVVRSSETMSPSLNESQDEFSNVVYDINGPSHTLDERGYTGENPFPSNELGQYNTDGEDAELDQFHIKPYTVEPRFEDVIQPQLPDFPPAYEEDSKYVTTLGETDTWGDFSLDDFQGRNRMEEEMTAEANREPLRPVHRSPMPWLQRDVNQVGQSRQPTCQLELNRGIGPDEVSSWYYDSNEMRCRWFGYRGYGGNANRFASRAACEGYCIKDMENLCEAVRCSWTGTHCALVSDQPCIDSAKAHGRDWRTRCPPEQPVCMSRRSTRIAPDIDFRSIPLECLQEKDPGSCERKNPSVMFHYDRERNDCMTFYFHDCGGNDNRFETKSDCMSHCSP